MSLLPACRQLLLCLAADSSSTTGRLQRFERMGGGQGGWQPVGAALPVTLGRNGLAWGMASPPCVPGIPGKIEGDGRAPAGVFAVEAVFGDAAADSPFAQALRLPYLAARPGLQCVDDPLSAHYNRIVDREAVTVDWASAEEMRRPDGHYAIGAVIGYNCRPAVAGRGSCIFLHVWAAPGVATAGCTAMSLDDMRSLALWLDAAAVPCLVQLPEAEYRRRQRDWDLPAA